MSSGSPPVRRRLTAEARRAAILDSARAVFSARGYHSASIDDIAGEAGVSKALIYEHFASKQELYANLLESHAAELSDRLAAAVAGVEGSEPRLETGLDAFFRFVEERREAWRILFREAADPEVVAVLDRVVAQVTALVATMIAAEPGARNLRGGRGGARRGHPPARPDAGGRDPIGGQLVGGPPRGPAGAPGAVGDGVHLAGARSPQPRGAPARRVSTRR